jgi:hypothetical protein
MRPDWIVGFDPSPSNGNAVVAVRAMRDRMDKAPGVRVLCNRGDFAAAVRGVDDAGCDPGDGRALRVLVAVERVKSTGQSGDSLLRTSEAVGRMRSEAAHMGNRTEPVFRSDVLRYLDVLGQKGNRDAQVKAAISAAYGCSSWREAVGKKSAPGPLYGIAGDGWAALGVALTAAYREVRGELEGWER